jgi:hypothetical protein
MSERDEKARREFTRAHKAADVAIDLIEPTADEARNGWDAETLTAYVRDQTAAAELRADPASVTRRVKPVRASSKYNPFRWRR